MSEVKLMGYRRKCGDIGIRNNVAIIAAMDNSNPVVRRVAAAVRGSVFIAPSFGRGMMGADYEQHKNTLIGMGTNPNIYGAIVISLEAKTANAVAEGIAKTGRPVETFVLEEVGGTIKCTELATQAAIKMTAEAGKMQREPMDWSELVIGVECGGSDGTSGLVSNPVTGLLSDMVIDNGGTVEMSETFEILGAEHLLAARAKDEETAKKLIDAVEFCVTYSAENGIDPYATNPAPDNIKGGLSTIEEKALGAVKKGGSRKLQEVVGYGMRPKFKGFVVMDAPCPGIENMTALASGGCHLIVFSTGKGNTSGNPISPTIKVSGNPETVVNLADNIDVDVSAVISKGMSLEDASKILVTEMINVCNGKMTKAEMLGETETSISRLGRCL